MSQDQHTHPRAELCADEVIMGESAETVVEHATGLKDDVAGFLEALVDDDVVPRAGRIERHSRHPSGTGWSTV